MKQCSLQDFMEELKPWLDTDHIRSAELSGSGRLTLYFLDGMKNVYQIDDCNEKQIGSVVNDLRKRGIMVKE
ncbi:MAG: hypothetical protein A2512_12790 [Deltaproteobacteria bacterium RIFOXYD12_FULL_56_24]|nr:MAG: hypothetical protein A2512_12790 [Deltaproteobacteria bacterium RIFOXYD12_FULL_56_24]